jgi:hypothetical protein
MISPLTLVAVADRGKPRKRPDVFVFLVAEATLLPPA